MCTAGELAPVVKIKYLLCKSTYFLLLLEHNFLQLSLLVLAYNSNRITVFLFQDVILVLFPPLLINRKFLFIPAEDATQMKMTKGTFLLHTKASTKINFSSTYCNIKTSASVFLRISSLFLLLAKHARLRMDDLQDGK